MTTYLAGNFVTKQPASTSGAHGPCVDLLGITPDQIAESAFVRNLLCSRYYSDLIKSPDLRGQSTVDAENLAIDNGGESEKVEDLAARLPDRGIAVLSLAFFVETIHLGDLTGLVVASNECYAIWKSICGLVNTMI